MRFAPKFATAVLNVMWFHSSWYGAPFHPMFKHTPRSAGCCLFLAFIHPTTFSDYRSRISMRAHKPTTGSERDALLNTRF
jgi:hypothetical protein